MTNIKSKVTKRIVTPVIIALLVIATAITAIAVLTSSSEKNNIFSVGTQTIEISEDKFEISSDDIIVPDEPFEKNPTITNKGTTDCYIRTYLGFSDHKLGKENVLINIGEQWVKGDDGYYYYSKPLAPQESVEFFSEITVTGIDKFDCDIIVYAESIDAENKDYIDAWAEYNVVPA